MKLTPIGDHVVVKPLAAETTTASGIIIPDSTKKERSEKGEVIAVGPGSLNEKGERNAPEVKVGQTVLFKSWDEPVEMDGEEYLIISHGDIKAIIE